MGRHDKPLSEQKPTRREIRQALADARDTPIGNLGISTDDAIEAVRKGQQEDGK